MIDRANAGSALVELDTRLCRKLGKRPGQSLKSAELARREDEIVARVRRELEARWESEVARTVEQRLVEALAKVKAEMSR